jgi:hypothetical protein
MYIKCYTIQSIKTKLRNANMSFFLATTKPLDFTISVLDSTGEYVQTGTELVGTGISSPTITETEAYSTGLIKLLWTKPVNPLFHKFGPMGPPGSIGVKGPSYCLKCTAYESAIIKSSLRGKDLYFYEVEVPESLHGNGRLAPLPGKEVRPSPGRVSASRNCPCGINEDGRLIVGTVEFESTREIPVFDNTYDNLRTLEVELNWDLYDKCTKLDVIFTRRSQAKSARK